MKLPVRSTLVRILILIAIGWTHCFSQQNDGPKAPRIIIKLPDNVAPGSVWIRYLVDRRISRGEPIRVQGDSREYLILRPRGPDGQPENVKIVLYSSGCKFKIYDLALVGVSDLEEPFQCDPLPTKTLRGFISPNEIPRATYSATEKRLDVAGELEADWICSFFLQPNGGSCLGSGVPLGRVGILDPAEGGRFEITIPDFSRDPSFKLATGWKSEFGTIEMGLHDRTVGVVLGGIMPMDSTLGRRALIVQADYPDTIVFTRTR
jgi:hypothetical protein